MGEEVNPTYKVSGLWRLMYDVSPPITATDIFSNVPKNRLDTYHFHCTQFSGTCFYVRRDFWRGGTGDTPSHVVQFCCKRHPTRWQVFKYPDESRRRVTNRCVDEPTAALWDPSVKRTRMGANRRGFRGKLDVSFHFYCPWALCLFTHEPLRDKSRYSFTSMGYLGAADTRNIWDDFEWIEPTLKCSRSQCPTFQPAERNHRTL